MKRQRSWTPSEVRSGASDGIIRFLGTCINSIGNDGRVVKVREQGLKAEEEMVMQA